MVSRSPTARIPQPPRAVAAALCVVPDERTKPVPMVVPTSYDEPQDAIGSDGPGAGSPARNPVKFDPFGEAVRQLHLFRIPLNERPQKVEARS